MKPTPFRTRAAVQSDFVAGQDYCGASMGVVAPGRLAMEILGDEISFGLLFTYCFRRFGFPNTGSDSYKEIAEYRLTTPMPGLFLDVSVKANTSTSLLFGYVMACTLADQLQDEHDGGIRRFHADFLAWRKAKAMPLPRDAGGEYDYEEDMRQFEPVLAQYLADGGVHYRDLVGGPGTEAVLAALRATLEDLKTPVGVRDCLFSAISDSCDDPDVDADEAGDVEDDEQAGIAKAHHTAGYFIPPDYLADPKLFVALSKELIKMGSGDLAAGIAAFVGARRQKRRRSAPAGQHAER